MCNLKLLNVIGIVKIISTILPLIVLWTIHKSVIMTQLVYVSIIFDKHCNKSLSKETENVQCIAPLAIRCAIQGFIQEKLYQKMGFKSFSLIHLYRKRFLNLLIKFHGCILHPT